MAVRLEFINLIVPVATLDRLCREQGGFARVYAPLASDMLWHDAHLCRVDGVMNWPDVDDMIARWEARGLQGLVGVVPHQWWKDLAVCASRRGPTFPCDWLSYDAADNCVYLSGAPKGEVMGPDRPVT